VDVDLPLRDEAPAARGAQHLRHVIALLIAATIAGLVFAAYRQPDFIPGLAAFRLC
jgi:hypothetical protein